LADLDIRESQLARIFCCASTTLILIFSLNVSDKAPARLIPVAPPPAITITELDGSFLIASLSFIASFTDLKDCENYCAPFILK
jgi:hypothetical protein